MAVAAGFSAKLNNRVRGRSYAEAEVGARLRTELHRAIGGGGGGAGAGGRGGDQSTTGNGVGKLRDDYKTSGNRILKSVYSWIL